MVRTRAIAVFILVLGLALGYFSYASENATEGYLSKFPFKLGLDLSGGTHLVYRADTTDVEEGEIQDSMDALRDLIERRVNLFGVSEPVVQSEEVSFGLPEPEQRLIVELPGVTDVDQAIALIGETPFLEFKTERPAEERDAILAQIDALRTRQEALDPENPDPVELAAISAEAVTIEDPYFVSSELTGKYLESARLEFSGQGGGFGLSEPIVTVQFDSEGSELFAQLTRENIGKPLAIYLDRQPISQPIVQDEIVGGSAVISGGFTPEEAKLLAGRLNSGALPVAIELISTQKVGATLGNEAFERGVRAGLYGLLLVAIFLLLWYRLPGLLAIVALCVYLAAMVFLFKVIPVTLTAAGIAGLILSIGMAVDANILIFERVKEERRKGLGIRPALENGFERAWPSIRDGNISSLLTAAVLFWFGTSLVQGFALTFGLGVLVSMWSAIVVTRRFLLAVAARDGDGGFFFGTAFSKTVSSD